MAEPFATFADLEARWRLLEQGEAARATILLFDASNMIRERWPDVDARIASGDLLAGTLLRIVTTMVKTAMQNPDVEGIESRGVTTGPFGDNVKYSNPDGALYLRNADIAILNGRKSGRAFAVDLSQPGQCNY